MFDSFLAHLLVLFLLYISALRIFFLKEPRVDSAAVVSLFAFISSLLTFPIWGVSPQSISVAIIAALFFFTNVRAIFRVASELFVDHYSIQFIIATLIELVLLIFVTIFVVYFRPVKYAPVDFSVNKETLNMTGSFANGFRLEKEYADKVKGRTSGKLNIYTPIEKIQWISSEDSVFNLPAESEILEKLSTSETPLLLFVGTPYGTVANYEPYFIFLAQRGFTVLAADFFPLDRKIFVDYRKSNSMIRFAFLNMFANKRENFDYLKPVVIDYTKKGYEALSRIALVNFRNDDGSQKKLFYLVDGLDTDSIFSFTDKFNEQLSGIFQMNLVPEYKTSGFGFPEQTDLLLAHNLGVKRDKEFFIPRYLSFKTSQKILGSTKSEKSDSESKEEEPEAEFSTENKVSTETKGE